MCENRQLPDLRFNFHDALLIDFQIGPRRELTLHINLYSVFYPNYPSVQVRFGAITNFESVQRYMKKLDAPNNIGDYYARFETLRFDTDNLSTAGNLFFYLELDRTGNSEIQCGKFEISVLEG